MKKHKKVIDETVHFSLKKGNGTLKAIVCVDERGNVTRYSLAYINAGYSHRDNGRIIGYDNCHGYHHRHYFGKEERVNFTTYEDIAERFDAEWRVLREKIKSKK